MKTQSKRIWILVAAGLFTVGFIFWNSMQDSDVSNTLSRHAADMIARAFGLGDLAETREFHKLIRKLAHFTEFAALGILLSLYFVHTKLKAWQVIFIAGAIACCDEFIQIFSDRTNSVKDILLDTAGATTGIFLIYILAHVIRRRRDKRISRRQSV